MLGVMVRMGEVVGERETVGTVRKVDVSVAMG
jgi:hypothetical protein